VGTVIEIGNSVSRIILINDDSPWQRSSVPKYGDAGSQEGICRLKYLNLDEDIKTGDEIVSSGKNSRFPSGIPVGEVTCVSREQSGLTLFAIVKPRVKLSSLEEVLVITNY
jgi:rod shape-determining protein MreC